MSHIFSTTNGEGEANTKFSHAAFKLKIQGVTPITEETPKHTKLGARQAADKALQTSMEVINKLKTGTFKDGLPALPIRDKTWSVENEDDQEYGNNSRYPVNNYFIKFTLENLDNFGDYIQALKPIEECEINEVKYLTSQEDSQTASNEAFKDAWDKANKLFEDECKVTGEDKENFGYTYDTSYKRALEVSSNTVAVQTESVCLSASDASDAAAQTLSPPELATFKCTVTIKWYRKEKKTA